MHGAANATTTSQKVEGGTPSAKSNSGDWCFYVHDLEAQLRDAKRYGWMIESHEFPDAAKTKLVGCNVCWMLQLGVFCTCVDHAIERGWQGMFLK